MMEYDAPRISILCRGGLNRGTGCRLAVFIGLRTTIQLSVSAVTTVRVPLLQPESI